MKWVRPAGVLREIWQGLLFDEGAIVDIPLPTQRATITLFWVGSFIMALVSNASPVQAFHWCFDEHFLEDEVLWTPVAIAHAPYGGSGDASSGWSSFSEWTVGAGPTQSSDYGIAISTSDGKTVTYAQLMIWAQYEHHDHCFGTGTKYSSRVTNWEPHCEPTCHVSWKTVYIYGASQQTDEDDKEQFTAYHKICSDSWCPGYWDSIVFRHRYTRLDAEMDTRGGSGATWYVSGSQGWIIDIEIDVTIEVVTVGAINIKASQAQTWYYKYDFPSGGYWCSGALTHHADPSGSEVLAYAQAFKVAPC